MSETDQHQTLARTPYTLAMVVCEAAYRDMATLKTTLLGIFTTIGSQVFPAMLSQVCVYLAVTDGLGSVPITLKVVDVDETEQPLFEQTVNFDFPDPLVVLETIFQIQNLPFPAPGEYRVQLFAANEPLMERRLIMVGPATPPPTASDPISPQTGDPA